jgi:type II secretory pathway component GspD/PulD (secretin)
MRIKRMVVFPALFFCLCAHAQTLAWKGADFSLRARKISLAAVLQNLAENYDTPVVIDPAIVETFSGEIPPASPVAILNRLTTQYNLVTWLDGNTLFVYPASRVAHRVITLNTLPASTFIRYLRKRDVPEKSSCEARTIPGVNAIDISGVPACTVRDRSVNMAGYRKLIGELDRRPQMIEISVTIIDVDAGDVSQLGIDWSAALSLGGGSISFNGPDSSAGGGFSTVISNTPSFMARLVALEKNSHAYILSQPSVVTLNNIQAVLDKNITFYTKLQGDKVAKLESITTGSLLRVTPRLLEEQGKQNIMLSLNIQDGQQNPPDGGHRIGPAL